MIAQDDIGVDIARDWIDVFHRSAARHERIAPTRQALARFAAAARGCLVVLGASGGHGRPVTEALADAGTAYARVNPRQARDFARAAGRLARTDRLDAEVPARMGRALNPRPTVPDDPDRARQADLVARRAALTGSIGAEKARLSTTRDRWLRREVAGLIRVLPRHLATVEAEIAARRARCKPLGAEARRRARCPASVRRGRRC